MAAPHALSIYVTHAMPLQPDRSGFKSLLSLSSCVSVGQLLPSGASLFMSAKWE